MFQTGGRIEQEQVFDIQKYVMNTEESRKEIKKIRPDRDLNPGRGLDRPS